MKDIQVSVTSASTPSGHSEQQKQANPAAILIVGDVLAFVIFVVLGRISHHMTSDWLVNVARIATPFLLGWFVVGVATGIYRRDLVGRPTVFMLRSVVTWVLGVPLGFLLRKFVFHDNVTVPFALTSLAFTALFLIGWRGVFSWWFNRART
jgi:Na+-driven multidrug efflux pump